MEEAIRYLKRGLITAGAWGIICLIGCAYPTGEAPFWDWDGGIEPFDEPDASEPVDETDDENPDPGDGTDTEPHVESPDAGAATDWRDTIIPHEQSDIWGPEPNRFCVWDPFKRPFFGPRPRYNLEAGLALAMPWRLHLHGPRTRPIGSGWRQIHARRFRELAWMDHTDLSFGNHGPVGLLDVHGFALDRIIGVGIKGTILRFDGRRWHGMPSGTDVNLNAIAGTSWDDLFAVGDSGTILHFDGTAWAPMESGTIEHLNAVYADPVHGVIAVGRRGVILTLGDGVWHPMEDSLPQGLFRGLREIAGHPDHGVYVLDDYLGLHHFDGEHWHEAVGGGVPPEIDLWPWEGCNESPYGCHTESTGLTVSDAGYVTVSGNFTTASKSLLPIVYAYFIYHFDGVSWQYPLKGYSPDGPYHHPFYGPSFISSSSYLAQVAVRGGTLTTSPFGLAYYDGREMWRIDMDFDDILLKVIRTEKGGLVGVGTYGTVIQAPGCFQFY